MDSKMLRAEPGRAPNGVPAVQVHMDLLVACANLLRYSMADIGWQWEDLTDEEKRAVGSPEMLDRLMAVAGKYGDPNFPMVRQLPVLGPTEKSP